MSNMNVPSEDNWNFEKRLTFQSLGQGIKFKHQCLWLLKHFCFNIHINLLAYIFNFYIPKESVIQNIDHKNFYMSKTSYF